MNILLHDWQSTPGGGKPTYLRDHGHEVPTCIAQAEYDRHHPDIIVGSSP